MSSIQESAQCSECPLLFLSRAEPQLPQFLVQHGKLRLQFFHACLAFQLSDSRVPPFEALRQQSGGHDRFWCVDTRLNADVPGFVQQLLQDLLGIGMATVHDVRLVARLILDAVAMTATQEEVVPIQQSGTLTCVVVRPEMFHLRTLQLVNLAQIALPMKIRNELPNDILPTIIRPSPFSSSAREGGAG